MKLNFLQDVLVLPGSVLTHSAGADAAYLRVLLWLASNLTLAEKTKHRQLAKLADCDTKTVKKALDYWITCGLLSKDEASEEAVPAMAQPQSTPEQTPARRLLERANELPSYRTDELADLLEKRETLRILVNEAQQMLGKIFNTSEVNILVGMLDYLGMSEECVLLLLAHCKRIGKTNLRSIEKYACSLADKGITEASAMEEELRLLEELHSFEGEVRAMFGMKSRALTSKESKMLKSWVSFGYGADVVRRAYEMTVNATGEASLPYANAILERWNAEGLKDLAAIDAAEEERQKKQEAGSPTSLGNSFDTDEFFEAALKRSFSGSSRDSK